MNEGCMSSRRRLARSGKPLGRGTATYKGAFGKALGISQTLDSGTYSTM